MMMKKIFSFAIVCLACLSGQAQLTVRDIFAAAPDSIFPLMTQNNRLDCLDFKENNMQARVRNLLDTYTEMTDLTPFYLRIQMTERSTAQLRLLSASDSIFCLINTYWGPHPDSHIKFTQMSLRDLTLISIDASSGEETLLTYTLQTGELAGEEKRIAQEYTHPLVYRWNGKEFDAENRKDQ